MGTIHLLVNMVFYTENHVGTPILSDKLTSGYAMWFNILSGELLL